MGATKNYIANGTIRTFRFVKADATNDSEAQECNANELAVGVSDGSNIEFDTDNHAVDGDTVRLQDANFGEVAHIECAGTIVSNGLVKSDADGKAVAIATTGTTEQNVNGKAMMDGADGKIIEIQFLNMKTHPATT